MIDNKFDDDDCPPPDLSPLYGRTYAKNKNHIICVEDEDSIHTLYGITEIYEKDIGAVTSIGGAGNFRNADWRFLAGRTVYLWPNNDKPEDNGKRTSIDHMKEIQKVLKRLNPAPKIFWINPYELDLEPNGSPVDFFDRYEGDEKKIEQLHAILANAVLVGTSKSIKKRIEDSISGKRETVKLPWMDIHNATQAIKPGTVTLLCGDGGAAKSLCALQLCQYWHFDLGYEVVIYELEDNRDYHVMRALAQCEKEAGLTNEEWIKDNPGRTREIFDANVEFINKMGKLIFEAPTKSVSLQKLAEWVDEQARAGKRIICIDPITAASAGRDTWIEDQIFMSAVKKSIVECGASLFLITHPKKGGGRSVGPAL